MSHDSSSTHANIASFSAALDTQPTPVPPLLALPTEIRQQIYSLIIGRKNIHLIYRKNSVARSRKWSAANDGSNVSTLQDDSKKAGFFPLLLACHAIYQDAFPLIYSRNLFSITNPKVFIHLARHHPSCLAAIRSLEVRWIYRGRPRGLYTWGMGRIKLDEWREFWQIVANHLTNLRSLRLRTPHQIPIHEEEKAVDEEFFRAMLVVRDVEIFVETRQQHEALTTRRCASMEDAVDCLRTNPQSGSEP